MKIEELFKEQHRIEKKQQRKLIRKSFLLYISDKWIDFLALVVAAIALVRTF